MLIGGSSKSPYIQEALHSYFEDSEILVPMDLQTHVSQGAAIHSLLFNGMNKCLIQPITSEPILIITKDDRPKIILPAGTEIPCNTIGIDDLVTSRDGQKIVELPICVGNTTKMLFNLKIESSMPNGFPINTPIQLIIEVNADKMLIIHATCMGTICHVEPLSPFANKELTTEERAALKAERQANLEAEQNGGVPSKETLITLKQAYLKIGNDFKAAETLELQNELYPNVENLNSIGVLYHNSGNNEKAAEFFEQAIQQNPNNEYAHFNLGNTMKFINKDVYKREVRKAYELNPNYDIALIEAGLIDKAEGKTEDSSNKFHRAYDHMLQQWKTNTLKDSASLGWLAAVAHELGENDIANQVMASAKKLENDSYYNKENLSKIRDNVLTNN